MADGMCRLHIFGQVEVAHTFIVGNMGDAFVDVERAGRYHGVDPIAKRRDRVTIGNVQDGRINGRLRNQRIERRVRSIAHAD